MSVLIQLGCFPFGQSMCHAGDAHGLYLVYSRTVTWRPPRAYDEAWLRACGNRGDGTL